MSDIGSCSCTLQARLHQVENARSREMKAHGELVQQLQHELESRRTSEAEIRLMAAKLRTDKCRLEAETAAANTKVRQLLEQLDAQITKSSQIENEFKAVCTESKSKLQVTREANEQLLDEKREHTIELSGYRNKLENVLSEKEHLIAKNEELCMKVITQVVDIEKLSAVVVSKQQEIESYATRLKLLIDDLTGARDQHNVMQSRLLELERDLSRALVMRNRALQWRRKHRETLQNKCNKMKECNELNRGRLQLVGKEVLKRCSEAKTCLQSIRQACGNERIQIQSLRAEFCQVELPKLHKLAEMMQNDVASQRVSLNIQREQLIVLRQDAENRLQAMTEKHKTQLTRQSLTFFQALATRGQRESHRRTFNAWKDLYLRSIVGQATHTAMIFSSQQPLTSPFKIPNTSHDDIAQSWVMPVALRPTSVAIQPLELDKLDTLRSPRSQCATPIDTMWRKWRRIDAGRK